jgi:hypothetical protein
MTARQSQTRDQTQSMFESLRLASCNLKLLDNDNIVGPTIDEAFFRFVWKRHAHIIGTLQHLVSSDGEYPAPTRADSYLDLTAFMEGNVYNSQDNDNDKKQRINIDLWRSEAQSITGQIKRRTVKTSTKESKNPNRVDIAPFIRILSTLNLSFPVVVKNHEKVRMEIKAMLDEAQSKSTELSGGTHPLTTMLLRQPMRLWKYKSPDMSDLSKRILMYIIAEQAAIDSYRKSLVDSDSGGYVRQLLESFLERYRVDPDIPFAWPDHLSNTRKIEHNHDINSSLARIAAKITPIRRQGVSDILDIVGRIQNSWVAGTGYNHSQMTKHKAISQSTSTPEVVFAVEILTKVYLHNIFIKYHSVI